LTVGALWLSVISKIGIVGFVNVVGAIIAPFFGILVIDYYIIRHQNINMNDLFSAQPTGAYYYTKAGIFVVLSPLLSALCFLSRQYSYRTWQNSKVTASY
jgi:cytosine/uracil/thiamine/allantoin permease